MIGYNFHSFPIMGWLSGRFSTDELQPILDEIFIIQEDFENPKNIKSNSSLAGQLEYEFKLEKCKQHIEKLMIPLIIKYDKKFDYIREFSSQTSNTPIVLDSAWVNFQKKYEYNPPHNHTGFMSFVIWIKVPYNLDDEINSGPGLGSDLNQPGAFVFCYSDSTGMIKPYQVPIMKEAEGGFIIFPAKFVHSVNPFYTCEGYRISVSGNFKFDVTGNK